MRSCPSAPGCAALALALSLLVNSPARADLGGESSPWKAIVGARLVTGPGVEPFAGTVLVREGQIEAVGASVELPPGTLIFERPGRILYPGLIEPYLEISATGDAPATSHENAKVRPERRVVESLPLDDGVAGEFRDAGFTTVHVVADAGILRGQTAVVSLGGGTREDVLHNAHAQTLAFERTTWTERAYPNSLMGSIALTRQTLLDASWSADAQDAWRRGSRGRPEANASWDALRPVLAGGQRLWVESEDVRMLPRAVRLAEEFDLSPVLVTGNNDEYRRLGELPGWLSSVGASLVLTVDFPEAPSWRDDDDRNSVELDTLLHWERAPRNPARLAAAGIPFAVTTTGLDSAGDVRERMRVAIRHGLAEETALAALTTEPARLLGLDRRLGTLETGKDANFVLCDDELFAAGSTIEEVWIDGTRHGEAARRLEEKNVTKKWDLRLGEGESAQTVRIALSSGDDGLEGRVVAEDEEESDAETDAEAGADAEADAEEGQAGADADAKDDAIELRDVKLERGVLRFVLPREAGLDGEYLLELERDAGFLRGRANVSRAWRPAFARAVKKEKKEEPVERLGDQAPEWPPVYPTGGTGSVVVRNATIWTCGPDGTQNEADLLVVDGRIRAVGADLRAPSKAVEVDGAGLHVTPGLIDCHSHSSITGGVNECTNTCTAEVRIGDVVNPASSAIYRELAGGLTISNLLHGSCNVIGGQNAVIKLKYGAPAADLFFGAPQGIKFALGENVKQSNFDLSSSQRTRYPQTRMGVEQFLRERFHAAEDYRAAWNRWRKDQDGMPPRRDLQLDALVEILDGDRLVHCHSYRADEIIMLMRVAEDFGFRIATFQHVLEGYKCANELAAHGAGASAFSDWWSYKYEVVDAIPYAGQIMWNRGVLTSFNSDSSELSRRMNLEAAKAVKYGRVPEEEALKFVTLNPAIQLGIGDRVGSLEKDKDGDFVLWSGPPLSDFSIPLGTWIEGNRVFSREDDLARREAAFALRERLLEKAEEDSGDGKSAGKKRGRGADESPFGQRWQDSEVAHLEMGDCIDTCCGEVE